MKYNVTIVTVCYNAEAVIEKTIQSVLGQTYDSIEYIIVDGCSTDGTLAIIEKYKDRISKVISEPDDGIYDAMNKGIHLATGKWIQFLNAGDTFFSEGTLARIFKSDYKADVIYGDCKVLSSLGTYILLSRPIDTITSGEVNFCHQSAFVRTILMKERLFDLRYKVCADYAFFYRVWKENHRFQYITEVVSVYDISGGSFSAGHYIQAKTEALDILGIKGPQRYTKLTMLYGKNLIRIVLKKIMPSIHFYDRTKRSLEASPYVKDWSWK